MPDLSVSTETTETDCPTLFRSALADRWPFLPMEVRSTHGVQDRASFSGIAKITRGRSIIARLIAWFVGFPSAGDNVPVTVTKTRTDDGEVWERDSAGRTFRSVCLPSPHAYHYRERFWPLTIELALEASDGSMHLLVRRGWFLGIAIPSALLPMSESREYAHERKFHFDIALSAPIGIGLVVRYRGWLLPDPDKASERHGSDHQIQTLAG